MRVCIPDGTTWIAVSVEYYAEGNAAINPSSKNGSSSPSNPTRFGRLAAFVIITLVVWLWIAKWQENIDWSWYSQSAAWQHFVWRKRRERFGLFWSIDGNRYEERRRNVQQTNQTVMTMPPRF
ncbi:MAG: hypothetical protein K8T89_07140 [Planctomycetes bacterium]|nr:hypothetical protein [Planctomycetota bacterium]